MRVIFLAILWSTVKGDNQYEVRSAGRTVRLYTNGVFHSQFNASRVLGGALWDLLSLPSLLDENVGLKKKKVLVLGLGGGAVVQQLCSLLDRPRITAIDLDPVHLDVATRWFGVSSTVHSLHCADAVEWLTHYRGGPFDLIIDDLFGHTDGVASRAVKVDNVWADLLSSRLAAKGVLVVNYGDQREAARSALLQRPEFLADWQFTHPLYHNAVYAHLRFRPVKKNLINRIEQHESLSFSDKKIALEIAHSRIVRKKYPKPV